MRRQRALALGIDFEETNLRLERGGLAGILTERDIVHAFADKDERTGEFTVGDYMTKNVAACMEADTVQEVMDIMTRCRFRHMPVMDKGKLTGIVSIGDIAKTRFRSKPR